MDIQQYTQTNYIISIGDGNYIIPSSYKIITNDGKEICIFCNTILTMFSNVYIDDIDESDLYN